jgi:hypothetical protein
MGKVELSGEFLQKPRGRGKAVFTEGAGEGPDGVVAGGW